ncbi:MAG: ankyrin repeat domain-containing protein, partial [Verrucomicrobia bacterium]|nr:ankyrin repeat domain-containing protein [Verrucomicrobiota bacterium]
MSFVKDQLNQASSIDKPVSINSSSEKLMPALPRALSELRVFLQSQDLVMDLVSLIVKEQGQKVRWADRQPLCAKELVQTLFSKKKYDQVVLPFFSVCAEDPGLKKALMKIASYPSSDKRSEKVQVTLEKNIQALAEHPTVFFELANESIKHQNRRLAQSLLAYCNNNPEFVQKNLKEFSNLVKRSVHTEDLVVVEYILDNRLDRFLENDDRSYNLHGGLELSHLLIYKRWNTLDLLIQKGKVLGKKISDDLVKKGENPEKIDLLIANGAVVDKPYDYLGYENERIVREKRAFRLCEMRKALHEDGLSPDYLKTLKPEDLWRWLCSDLNAASVLAKHPEFFRDLLFQQPNPIPNFDLALKAYSNAGIFNPKDHGIPLLFKAISSNDCAMAMTLFQHGVPPNAIDLSNGWTGFEAALRSLSLNERGVQLFEFFLNHPTTDCSALFKDGSHPIDVLFQLNVPYKHVILKAMLDKGVSLYQVKLSLLERAVTAQPYDVPALKLLISHGISLNERTPNDDTVLHALIFAFAKETGAQREAILQLITHLAVHDPKNFDGLVNNDGKTVLDLAKEMDLPEVVLTLLQVGFKKESSVPVKGSGSSELDLLLSHFENIGVQASISDLASITRAYQNIDRPATPSELRPWLNLTNFAYFFGDAIDKYGTLKSSKKETGSRPGNSFNENGSFLTVLLSVCEKVLADKESPKDEVEAVATAKQKLERAVFCSKVLTQCSHCEEFKRRFLPVLSASIEAQIAALPPGESLLIPSGWSGQEGRYHAMLIEVVKNADGTCSLLVVNTDKKNGALLHAQRPTGLKDLINPIRAFDKIPQEKLFDTELIPSLLSLLAHFPEDGANQYGDKDYYHLLFSRLSEYAVALPEDKKLCFITAQRSGTCTIRCALAYLHVFLGTELYRKVKTEIEQIVFNAINDPEFIDKAAVNPDFLIHLEHAIERSALHVNKHKSRSDASLSQAKVVAALLSDVEKKISVAVKSSESSKKAEEVVNVAADPLQQAAIKLEESRQKLIHREVKAEPLAPFQPLVPPSIDFSRLSSGEEWIEAIDELSAFFEKSSQSPMDPNQTVATRLTTQALSTLALPNNGVFHPGIDAKTPVGLLSLPEKEVFRQKLGALCQKYATAMYNQRSAAAGREVERLAIWFGSHEEPYTEAESMEQYLCINKLFAHYWRLSLELEGDERGPASLSHYGIDTSHLEALKNSIHLPCYSPRTAQQLNELIEFFEQSHPALGKSNRTLLAIGDWSEREMKIVLPLKSSELEGFGETALCEEWYQRIPDKAWSSIDSKMHSVKGWTKPDIKKLRLAYLFAHPEMLQQSELKEASKDLSKALGLYSDLRKMAFTCWLFKRASHEDPVRFEEVEWSDEGKVLQTKFVAKSRLKELEGKERESKDPFLVGKLGHHLIDGQESALKRATEQNDYTIHESQRVHFNSRRFYEIAQAEEFAVHRLLCHYQENISDLKNTGDQVFFQLVLFGKEQLAKALRQDPAIGNRVLHLIEQALHEFDLQLQADPTKEELLRGIIFLNAIKLRLDSYLPGSFSEKERLMLQQEISQRFQAMDVKESTPQSSAIQTSRYAAANKAELRLLWICAQPSSSWTDLKSCEQALIYLGQFEFFIEQLGPDDHSIDPTLRALAYQTVFAHFNELKEAFANPEVLSRAAAQIAGVYGIDIGGDTVINGTFPQISFVQNMRLYEINLLSGILLRDKAPLVNPMKVLTNSVVREFSRGRKEPIEVYVLSRGEDATRFYSRSQGCEYYFTVHKLDERNWETQVEWTRGEETFCYMPPDKVPDELKRIALEQTPKLNNYYYWISKNPSKIAAIIQNRATGVEEVVIYADGTAERPSSKERWNYAAVESVPGLAVLASMQPKEQVAVWEKADLSDALEVHCFGLKDSRGAPFKLEGGKDPASLNVVNLPGYRLASEQTVKGLGRHFHYVIVHNEKGKQKAIVPVKIWSEVARGSKDSERSCACEEIAIDEKGNPTPSGIKQQLLLAYYFIGAKQYDRALGLLKQIDGSRVYAPEELQMLGWIFLHSKQTRDYSPKAVALSLMAARLAKENLENFPDVYPPDPRSPKVTGYYAEPKVWVQFWKGSVPFEKSAAKSQTLYSLLGEAFERYYEVSSHCTLEFQVHDKLLTPFQEALWLAEIVTNSLNHTLFHRLKFLLTGKIDPIIEEAKPQFQISFKFAEEMTGFDWLHSIDAGPDEYRPVLAFLNRIRPEKGLKEEFGKLFALATKGTAEEKNALFLFLMDMQHDPNEVNQLIRGILMSQLPPYDSGPISSRYHSYKSQRYDYYSSSSKAEPDLTMSQAIVKKVSEIASERHREGPTPSEYRGFYGYSNPEKQLTELVHEWQGHFFRSSEASGEEEVIGPIPKIETLLPPLAQQKKEKLVGQYEHDGDVFISKMNASAAQLFIPEEKQPSATAFPPLPATLQKDPYFQMR